MTYLAEADTDRALAPLQAPSCTYRIALGPRAGQKVLSLQSQPSRDRPSDPELRVNAHGFSLHAGLRWRADQRLELEQLCRYITRPAIGNERLKRNRAGQVVLQLKSPYKDGTSHIVMEPLEFMERLAEDIAVVDVISGGRFELGAGVGYKREEFDSFGVPFKERGARTDETLGIVRRLLDGESVTLKNKFFDFKNIRVTPEPLSETPPTDLGRRLHSGSAPPCGPLWRWLQRTGREPRRLRPLCRRVKKGKPAHRQHKIRQRFSWLIVS